METGDPSGGLASAAAPAHPGGMVWDEPYLETCCRAALHRLILVDATGRPAGLKDGPCLERIAGMGLARLRPDGRWEPTDAGRARHTQEILRRTA